MAVVWLVSLSATLAKIEISQAPMRWIATEFDNDIRGSQRMNSNDFCDPMTFPLAPP